MKRTGKAAPRGRPPKAPGAHHVALRITLPPADIELLDVLVDAETPGMETRSSTIGSLIRDEAKRRARRGA